MLFRRSSTASDTARTLTSQEVGFIASLEKLRQAYLLRSVLTFFTGDVVIENSEGKEIDRTKLKAKVAADLIQEIKKGDKSIRAALVESTSKYGLNPTSFLAGKTNEFLDNNELFTLLSTPEVSTATLTETSNENIKTLIPGAAKS